MQDSFLVDSCILLYLADKRDMKKHLRAIKWLEGVETKKFFISMQNIREVSSNLLKKTVLPSKEIIDFVDMLLNRFSLVNEDFNDYLKATVLCSKNRKNFFDAVLASTMQRYYITTIITENTKDFELLGVKAINPLK
jgi:predicted nucleic acid-binding protein